jgi:hypothetical protein
VDIVLIPAYMRPEYLSLCLEFLSKADGAKNDKEYWVCQDMRFHDEHRFNMQLRWTKEVLDKSPLPVRYIVRKPHSYAGNSYNTLEAYKQAYEETDARFIYLVEEDVLVTPDFFTWHEAVQAREPDTLCSIAYRCSRNHEAKTDITDAGAYFTSARDYASIGVCWKRERLAPLAPHARDAYYADQVGYIQRTFPGNRFAGDFCEQDGLIMRCMWCERAFTTWPYVPRAYHFGWFGYHRPNGRRPDGQLDVKVQAIRSQICDRTALKISAPDFGDIEPYDATLNVPFTTLTKEQHFE